MVLPNLGSTGLLRRLIYFPARMVFGEDIFVSYSRSDGATYAAGLANALAKEGFAVRIDQWSSKPDRKVPGELLRAIRRAATLVVVGTRAAAESTEVETEIRTFLPTGRMIVPIDIDGSIEDATWWPHLEGLAVSTENQPPMHLVVAEEKTAVTQRDPSEWVVRRISNSFNYTKRSHRLTRMATGAGCLLAVMLTISVLAGLRAADSARQAAEATENKVVAERAAERATAEATTARAQAAQANEQRKESEALAAIAEEKRARSEQLAQRAYLVSQARAALDAGDPDEAHQLAARSLELADGADARLLVADARNRGLSHLLHTNASVRDLAVDKENGRYVATVGMTTNGEELVSELWLGRIDGRGTPRTIRLERPSQHRAVAFHPSVDGLFVAVRTWQPAEDNEGARPQISIVEYDLQLRELWRIELEPQVIQKENPKTFQKPTVEFEVLEITDLKLSSDGEFLIMAGYATRTFERIISNATPYSFLGWFKITDPRIYYSIDDKTEYSSFHTFSSRIRQLSSREIVVNRIDDVFVVDLETGHRQKVGEHTVRATDLACGPGGQYIAAVGSDARLSLFKRSANGVWTRDVVDLEGESAAERVVFVNDDLVATTRENYSISLIHLDDKFDEETYSPYGSLVWKGRRETRLTGHDGEILDLGVSPDRQWLATAGTDGTVRLWPIGSAESLVRRGSSRGVVRVAFSPDGRYLIYGSRGGEVLRADVSDGWRWMSLVDPNRSTIERRVLDAQLDEGGNPERFVIRQNLGLVRNGGWASRELWASTFDGVVSRWNADLERIAVEKSAEGTRTPPKTRQGSSRLSDGRWLATVPDGGLVLREPPIEEPAAVSGTVAPGGRWFVQESDDGRLRIWDLMDLQTPTWEMEPLFSGPGEERLFSRSGRYFVFAQRMADESAFVAVDLEARTVRVIRGDFASNAAAVSDSGNVVLGGRTGEVHVHELRTGRSWTLPRHRRFVSSVDITLDGRWIASGSRDRTARLWSSDGFGFVSYSFVNPVEAVQFEPFGDRLAVVAGRSAHVFHVPDWEEKDAPSRRLGEPLNLPEPPEFEATQSTPAIAYLVHLPGKETPRAILEATLGRVIETDLQIRNRLVATVSDVSKSTADRMLAAVHLRIFSPDLYRVGAPLVEALASNRPEADSIVRIIVDGLRAGGSNSIDMLAAKWATEPTPRVKLGILYAISEIGMQEPSAQHVLREALGDSALEVRARAALILAGHEDALDVLAETLYEAHSLSEQAAEALPKYGVDAVPALLRACGSDKRPPFGDRPEELAEKALAQIGEAAAPLLIRAIEDGPEHEKSCAINALSKLDELPVEAATIFLAKIERDPSGVDSSIVWALKGWRDDDSRLAELLVQIISEDGTAWQAAIWVLGDMGAFALPPILNAWPKADSPVKRMLSWALEKVGPAAKPALPLLIGALQSGEWVLVSDAAGAIGSIGDGAAEAMPELVRQLPAYRGFTRRDLLQAISSSGACDLHCVDVVLAILVDETRDVDLDRYALWPSALEGIAEDGVPRDVMLKIEKFADSVPRPRGLFLSILARYLSETEIVTFGEIILDNAREVESTCDDEGVFEATMELLADLRGHKDVVVPAIKDALARKPRCADFREFGLAAIEELRAP